MLVVMKKDSRPEDASGVAARLLGLGVEHTGPVDLGRIVIHAPGAGLEPDLARLPGVERIVDETAAPFLCTREFIPEPMAVRAGDVRIGRGGLVVMAGPCAVESRERILETARAVKAAGADMLRGGAFKSRSSPYTFRGLGRSGLEYLAEASAETGLPLVTEALAPEDAALVADCAQVVQIGARNMQNWPLLEAVALTGRPVLLKRGLMASLEELLTAADYLLLCGAVGIVLCERGIRTFEPGTRNTLDLAAVPRIKNDCRPPVIVDPSHAAGRRDLVESLALAGVAAGADGLMIEVHPDPDLALSDGPQSVTPEAFGRIVARARALHRSLEKSNSKENRP